MRADESLLFIDANKYLDFYQFPQYRTLLPTLIALSSHVFVTMQIAHEVRRNKLRVFRDAVKSLPPLEIKSIEQFRCYDQEPFSSQVKSVQEQTRALNKSIEAFNKQLKAFAYTEASRISESEDDTSIMLEQILCHAIAVNEEELAKARQRKEYGDPPGKTSQPLGDQVSWEQLLSRVESTKAIWLLSRDQDFSTTVGDKVLLNPSLRRELLLRNSSLDIYAFTETDKCLTHFQRTTGASAAKMPDEFDLQQVRQHEEVLSASMELFETLPNSLGNRFASVGSNALALMKPEARDYWLKVVSSEIENRLADGMSFSDAVENVRSLLVQIAKDITAID